MSFEKNKFIKLSNPSYLLGIKKFFENFLIIDIDNFDFLKNNEDKKNFFIKILEYNNWTWEINYERDKKDNLLFFFLISKIISEEGETLLTGFCQKIFKIDFFNELSNEIDFEDFQNQSFLDCFSFLTIDYINDLINDKDKDKKINENINFDEKEKEKKIININNGNEEGIINLKDSSFLFEKINDYFKNKNEESFRFFFYFKEYIKKKYPDIKGETDENNFFPRIYLLREKDFLEIMDKINNNEN